MAAETYCETYLDDDENKSRTAAGFRSCRTTDSKAAWSIT